MNRNHRSPHAAPSAKPSFQRLYAPVAPRVFLALFALSLALPACVTHDRQMYRQQPWRKQKPASEGAVIELPPGVGLDPAPQAL